MLPRFPRSTGAAFFVTLSLHAAVASAASTSQYICRATADGEGWACADFAPQAGPIAQVPRPERTVVRRTTSTSVKVPKATAGAALAQDAEAAVESAAYESLDWVPVDQLQPEDRQRVTAHCAGTYVPHAKFDPTQKPGDSPLEASALNSIESVGDVAKLDGEVIVKQGYRQMRADRAEVDRTNQHALLEGNVEVREPTYLFRGDRVEADLSTGTARVENVEYVMHEMHARGDAASIVRREDEVVFINDGTYTTCPPDSEAWALNAREIELNPHTDTGKVRGMVLRVGGMPVFYSPYWAFPLSRERKSGFLFPVASINSESGLDVATPYYINLAPNYDMTLVPRFMSKRGFMLENEFRYLSDNDTGTVSAAYLPNDDDENGDERWLVAFDERGQWGNRWNSHIDYNMVSDSDYFKDLGSELNVTSSTNLPRLGRMYKHWDWWDVDFRLEGFQTLGADTQSQKPYTRLPQLTLAGILPDTSSGLEYLFETQYAYFDHNRQRSLMTAAEIASGADVTGHRVHLEPGLRLPLVWASGYLTPTVKLKHTQYYLTQTEPGMDDHKTRTLPMVSVDSGLYFERDTTLLGQAMTQTLEPRAYYLWVPYQRQDTIPDFDTDQLQLSYAQLFREDRFTGHDRVGEANQVSLGVTSRYLEANSGFERMSLSLGRAFYFQNRLNTVEGTTNSPSPITSEADVSPWVAEAVFRASDAWRMLVEWQYDDHGDESELLGLNLRYHPDVDHLFNIGYRERDSISLEATDLSMIWPIWGDWSFIGRWHRDWRLDRSLESLAGLEYESCCWKVRLAYRRWIADGDDSVPSEDSANSGVFLQFVMKGLGGVGNKLDTVLDDGIPGYRRREDESNEFGGSLLY